MILSGTYLVVINSVSARIFDGAVVLAWVKDALRRLAAVAIRPSLTFAARAGLWAGWSGRRNGG